MIHLLVLLASLASAQESSTDTISIPMTTQIEISNLGKDVRELQEGRPVIPGIPRYMNGICFDVAGTDCQTTAASTGGASPTRQTFTSGSGTYTTPADVLWIKVRMVAGGGGGGGEAAACTTAPTDGGASSFGTVVVSSGIKGVNNGASVAVLGAAGGTGGAGTATLRIQGGGGGPGTLAYGQGCHGGNTPLGFGGRCNNLDANGLPGYVYGGGGAGGTRSGFSGSG